MSVRVRNLVLMVLLAAMTGTVFLARRDYSKKNVEFMPGMVEPAAYETQAAAVVYVDGNAARAPSRGTIARGFDPLPYTRSAEDALRAGFELRNPLALVDSADNLARGAVVYKNVCSPCHGPGGAGDGLIPQRGFPPPPPLTAPHANSMKDGQLFHVITFGQGNMPPFAAQAARDDRWRVVMFIRRLQTAAIAMTPAQQ